MSNVFPTAEIIYQNFKSLSKKHRMDFMSLLFNDKAFERDLTDIAIINQRINEPSISIEDYLKKRKQKQN